MAKKAKTRKDLDTSLPIYRLKVSLEGVEPAVWRRFEVDDCTLGDLHRILQVVMGWDDLHKYMFMVDGEDYGRPSRTYDFAHDARDTWFSDLASGGFEQFDYVYDLSANWMHRIELETTLAAEPGACYPRCVEGRRACPPEEIGGPDEYPKFLAWVSDRGQSETNVETPEIFDELGQWLSEEFNPDKFEPAAINAELYRMRGRLGKEPGRNARPAPFEEGDLVEVKPGVVHPEYPDLPLGGWVGKVRRLAWLTPVGVGVRWTKATLAHVHPVYFKRTERDAADPGKLWLLEHQLEKAASKTPSLMQQPTELVTRPLSEEDPDDCVRMVFGLTSDDPLPKQSPQTQARFLEFLRANLDFPFPAAAWGAAGAKSAYVEDLTVLGFADPPLDPEQGILCLARGDGQEFTLPLENIEQVPADANGLHVETYKLWMIETTELEPEDPEDLEDSDAGEPDLQYPIGTIAAYGPNDQTTTKLVAGVILEPGAAPILKRWVSTDVLENKKVQREIQEFFRKYDVRQAAMSDGNLGCPHEEGKDFPVGGDCPFCPWWKGKQGSGATQ